MAVRLAAGSASAGSVRALSTVTRMASVAALRKATETSD
jgi:hypothetical protein